MIQDGIEYGEGYERATEPGPAVEFWTGKKWITRYDNTEDLSSEYNYRQPIKPKPITPEDKMSERESVEVSGITITIEGIRLSFDQVEKAHAEMQRIKAENEIRAGDWIFIAAKEHMTDYIVMAQDMCSKDAKKITNPAHIQALKEIYEGMK